MARSDQFVKECQDWLGQCTSEANRQAAQLELEEELVQCFMGTDPTADGLFSGYEFRVDESCTDDVVTPRVLSEIFELGQLQRHDSGTFYTPPKVAVFMASELLKSWLERTTQIVPERLESWLKGSDPDTLTTREKEELAERLQDLTIVDPACGCGALLVSFLQCWSKAVRQLTGELSDQTLRRFIQHQLCGVDTESKAIRICRLRIWLAYVAMSSNGRELPDIAANLMVGDAVGNRPTAEPGRQTWAEWFPAVMEKGGFDLVLANPPYVRIERIADREKLAQFGQVASRRADLYHCFIVLSVELLRDKGVATLITSNSWLDAKSGAYLQQFLIERAHLCGVFEPDRIRAFRGADINAAISVISQCGQPAACDRTRFCSLLDDEDAFRSVDRRDIWRTRSDLSATLGTAAKPVSGKWGGKFLRAPLLYHQLVEQNPDLLELSELCDVKGYIHDNTTGEAYPAVDFVKSVRQLTQICIDEATSSVIRYGVKDSASTRKVAPILFARTFGSRHLVAWNVSGVLGKEFYKVLPHAELDPRLVCAQLNSSWGILQREILGVANLGEGGIKFAGHDVGQFLLFADFGSDEVDLLATFEQLSRRPQLDIPAELAESDRRDMDAIILNRLGLPESRWDEFYEAVERLVLGRKMRGQWGRRAEV